MWTVVRRINDRLFTFLIADRRTYLFIAVFFVYLLNPFAYTNSDTQSTKLLPVSILRERNFDLNEFNQTYLRLPLDERNVVVVDGRVVSKFPVLHALLAVPFYIPFLLAGGPSGITEIEIPARLYSVFVAALSVVFLYMAAREISDERKALFCSMVYAFGTCTWSISSQDLWQHGTSQMFIALSLYFMLRGLKDERFTPYSGFTLACAVATRPANLVTAGILSLYIFREHRLVFKKFLFYATMPVLFVLSYSWVYFHSFLMLGQGQDPLAKWTTPFFYGLLSLLFSSSKGLFVYSPFLIFSFAGIYLSWKDKQNVLFKYISTSVLLALFMWSKWWAWHGTTSYGYRMLLDLTPLLIILLLPVFQKYNRNTWFWILFLMLVSYSVVIQMVGVFFFDDSWDVRHFTSYPEDGVSPYYWSIGESQLSYYMKKAFNTLFSHA